MSRWATAVIILAAIFLGGWWLGRRTVRPEVVETVRIEPVFYERPQPVSISDKLVEVNIPRLLFAPADTVDRICIVDDSVQLAVTERTLEYRDSTYYARVVGPVIGEMAPRLDYIETYNTTIIRTVTARPRFMLSAGAGTEYSRVGWTPYAEIDFSVDMKFATISATVGVDDVLHAPFPRFGVSAKFPLWSK